ncbi:MAG: hypothetical protein KC502_18660, partial [Myxococcales bacterium]|nr:hypothetical protein [Myxococcales bacterium]
MSDTPPPSSQPTARSLRMWWVLAGIVALTAALYGSVSTFGFVYDDNTLLVHNGRLHSWQGLADAWTSSMWSFDQWKSAGGFYRPITAMVQTTAWMAFGSDAGSWHLLSLMLHLLLVVTTYLLARALCLGRPAALFATAVVGLHPLMIQGATWISALSDPLSAILAYGALIVAVRSWPRVSWPAFVLLALAALTLERAWLLAPLPGLFALLVGPSQPPSSPDTPAVPWPHRWLQATRTGGPYLGAIALAVLLRALLLPATEQAVGPRDFTGLAAKIPGVAWQLLQSAMFPQHLSVAYTDPLPEPLLPLVGLSVVGAVMVWLSRNRPIRLCLCCGFWALLAAVSAGGAFNPGDLVQDRYIYAPMVLLALWAAALFGTSPDADSDQPMSLQRKVGWSAAVGWLLMLTWLHPANLEIWRDEVSLYRRAVLSAPAKPRF